MKAERRHELQENTLAHVLTNFPLYLSIYGGRILTVLLIVVLGWLLLRYRAESKRQQVETTRINLAQAREATQQMNGLIGGFRPGVEIASLRQQMLSDANAALDAVLANADTDTIKAEATVARGDLYWTAANLPELPGAATQPALALPEPRDSLLSKAAASYQSVVATYPDHPISVASALLGLASISENQGKFDEAERFYRQLKDSPTAPQMFKGVADLRLQDMPMIRKPRKLVPSTAPAIQPSILPTTAPAAPDLEATTQPATQPG